MAARRVYLPLLRSRYARPGPSLGPRAFPFRALSTPPTPPPPRITPRLQLTMTCTAPVSVSEAEEPSQCRHRSTHEFSRHAYEKGIVLVQCPECKTRSVFDIP
jgi:hypothetical protein